MQPIKIAAYAAILTTVFRSDCLALQKRSIVELDEGQLTSGHGEAVKEIPDGQIIAGAKSRVQQAPDGQIAAPKTEEQEQGQITTVIDIVSEIIAFEPITRFITVTGSK